MLQVRAGAPVAGALLSNCIHHYKIAQDHPSPAGQKDLEAGI